MIKVTELHKSYGLVQALRGAKFEARDGEITTLLGANGSGKTTTMRSLVGLIRPDQGNVEIDTVNVLQDAQQARAKMGWFPDNVGLYPRLTTREHISYFARLHGLQGSDLERAIDRVITLLDIGDIADRRVEGFSTGQSMKVALARVLVHKPKNLVLDEPTRGLDVTSIRQLRALLRELREAGHCILMSSHVMAEVQELSDRVVFIARGVVVADGTPAELIELADAANLEDAFVALVA